jgi:hypothetical protein
MDGQNGSLNLFTKRWVQGGEGFIQEEDRGPGNHSPRQGNSVDLPA